MTRPLVICAVRDRDGLTVFLGGFSFNDHPWWSASKALHLDKPAADEAMARIAPTIRDKSRHGWTFTVEEAP